MCFKIVNYTRHNFLVFFVVCVFSVMLLLASYSDGGVIDATIRIF
jgi:hypothetical protein